MKSLYDEMRSEKNIYSAWRHVRKNALASASNEIRGEASEFEHNHQAHLNRIVRQLRSGKFKFDKVKGVLKDRRSREAEGKDPRPIAIASMKNKVVQRAILQVLQPRTAINLKERDPKLIAATDTRLRKINEVNQSKYGVGGLVHPHGGVEPAIKFALAAMAAGGQHYFRTDIRSFFTAVPVDRVIKFVHQETAEEKLSNLFAEALEVHLSNADELGKHSRLFPKDGTGVAQGSSLSTFAANVLLYELDHELNASGVSEARYIDDVLIIAPDIVSLQAAVDLCQRKLSSLGLSIHPIGSSKSEQGLCTRSVNFLGCNLQPRRCVPAAENVLGLKKEVQEMISASERAIKSFIDARKPLDRKMTFASTIDFISKKVYGWQKSFAFCTDTTCFRDVDVVVADKVADYRCKINRFIGRATLTNGQVAQLLGVSAIS